LKLPGTRLSCTRGPVDLAHRAHLIAAPLVQPDAGNHVGSVGMGQPAVSAQGLLIAAVRPAKPTLNDNKKLSYRRGTARCVVSVEILPIATQQCRNYILVRQVLNQVSALAN